MDGTPIIIKKKKSHGHAHHGGSWKVAYADFVTAMMAFFMVMWIMGLSDETKAQIQGYFNDPVGFVKNEPKSHSVIALKSVPTTKKPVQSAGQPYQDDHKAMEKLKEDLKKELEKTLKSSPDLLKFLDHVKIEITEEGLRIEFLEDKADFFESGNAALKPGAMKVIQTLGPKIAASGRTMVVEGHTDSVPFANDPFGNLKLSTERALALTVALGQSGVSPDRIKDTKGLADRELRDPNHPTSAVNRRVTILLPFSTPLTASTPLPKDDVRGQMSGKVAPKVLIAPDAPNILEPH